MRLLADENFPWKAVAALRDLGHDVVWIKEAAPAIDDVQIFDWAVADGRILLTQDKDFGELAFHWGLPAQCGIVLFRVLPIPDRVAAAATRVLGTEADFRNRFVVVEAWRVRERPLPN